MRAKRFYIANRSGVTVCVRIDDRGTPVRPLFEVTFSDRKNRERPPPIMAFILADGASLYRIPFLENDAAYGIRDQTSGKPAPIIFEKFDDNDGDTILRLTGLVAC